MTGPGRPTRRRARALPRFKRSCSRTSGSTGTEMSGRDFMVKQPLHRLIDLQPLSLRAIKKGVGNRPVPSIKIKRLPHRFGLSKRKIFLIANVDKALCCRTLAKPDSEQPLHRYKLSLYYWRSLQHENPGEIFRANLQLRKIRLFALCCHSTATNSPIKRTVLQPAAYFKRSSGGATQSLINVRGARCP
jgi:hypothetical protein